MKKFLSLFLALLLLFALAVPALAEETEDTEDIEASEESTSNDMPSFSETDPAPEPDALLFFYFFGKEDGEMARKLRYLGPNERAEIEKLHNNGYTGDVDEYGRKVYKADLAQENFERNIKRRGERARANWQRGRQSAFDPASSLTSGERFCCRISQAQSTDERT